MNLQVMSQMVTYFQNDPKRINHALKVYSFAQLISATEILAFSTRDVINYTALLHDIGIKVSEAKYASAAGNYQELEGPPIARQILTELNISSAIIERCCFIIGNHHSYSKIDGIDFQILVEADFLVNIYEDDLDIETIKTIQTKFFKTLTGKKLLQSMYFGDTKSI